MLPRGKDIWKRIVTGSEMQSYFTFALDSLTHGRSCSTVFQHKNASHPLKWGSTRPVLHTLYSSVPDRWHFCTDFGSEPRTYGSEFLSFKIPKNFYWLTHWKLFQSSRDLKRKLSIKCLSVPDQWQFGTDPYHLLVRILLLSSLTFKIDTKILLLVNTLKAIPIQ